MTPEHGRAANMLRLRRLGIDTYQEPILFMSADCPVCRSEGWEALTRIQVAHAAHAIVATLNVVTSDLLAPDEVSLSDAAWNALGADEGDDVVLSHPEPVESLSRVRAKVYGQRLDSDAFTAIIDDIVASRYTSIHLAAFITACAGGRLDLGETIALTRAMVAAGDRLTWGTERVVDKHSVGGLPGNRTTMIVVPIVAARGLLMPKTSSRAITSPSGTADAMETVAPVSLDVPAIRRVVEREGGCIVWGGAVRLSPADDIIIRVERPLDIDSEGQLVASVLSKKLAAGSTHVVIDMPVGPTAKVRSRQAAESLGGQLAETASAIGLHLAVMEGDGSQPVGRGIGPALEAHDVLGVLQGDAGAPADLRDRAVQLAARVIELGEGLQPGTAAPIARALLDDGSAWRKFQSICDAQGGMREPPRAELTHEIVAPRDGRVRAIDNRRLARVAKLAGAPRAKAAGVMLRARQGTTVRAGQPLYVIHAESSGELAYARAYAEQHPTLIALDEVDA